uniref:Sensory neuron membrane protein n=1 Tax=Histia rhodope TaxID=1453155 RepID=A0A7G4KBY3_9NEOP|nr:sensory neuron membrane protein [Histia rhodope]
MMYEKWRKLPMPLNFKIYVFNVTNVEEVNAGANPKLVEIGPYVYKEYRERTDIEVTDNDTVRYMLKKSFVFDGEASGSKTEDDIITVIHYAYVAAIVQVHDTMASLLPILNPALQEFFGNVSSPFLTIKVKDLFFDGIFLNCNGSQQSLGLICSKIEVEKPPTMRQADGGNGFFWSMFGHLNRTITGPYEMARGLTNIQELGHIVSYQGKRVMTEWNDPYCGQINGSDSTIFPPIDENNVPSRLYSFEPDICRSLYISLSEKTTRFNMTAYLYEMDSSALASKSANPDNKCFCDKNWSANHDGCLVMGVLNLMPCQGSPAIVSLPHFYLASEEILSYIAEGIDAVKEKHKSYVYIDPSTGVPLDGLKRLQFNIELRKIPNIKQFENVKTGLFPLLWIEEGAVLPESLLSELRQGHTMIKYVEVFRWVLLAVALIVTAVSGYLVARAKSLVWPHHAPVSFVLQPHGMSEVNKVH